MEDETLRNIVQSRAQVKALLKSVASNTQNKSWISPHDYHLPLKGYDQFDHLQNISTLSALHQETIQKEKSTHQIHKLLVPFPIELPQSSPPRPSAEEVRSRIEAGGLNIGVYSINGYNFGLEYTNIYSGETLPETTFDDISAVLIRAVRVIDNTIDFPTAKTFADYIVRITCWEVDYAKLVTAHSLQKKFPTFQARVSEKVIFYSPYVYIGISDDSIPYFWVRLCPVIESTNTSTDNEREIDKALEKHTCCCYYHRHDLTIENCEELDLSGYTDSATGNEKSGVGRKMVPPPPKKINQSDIQLHLLLRDSNQSTSETLREISAEMGDHDFLENDYDLNDHPKSPSPQDQDISSSRFVCEPTPFADLVGWGRNTAYIFDPSQDRLRLKYGSTEQEDYGAYICYQPTKISIPPSINIERIAMIACSHRHLIVLSHNGSIYTCGDNTEGALGLGDTISRQTLTLLLWPISQENESSNIENPIGNQENDGSNSQPLIDKALQKQNSYKKIVCVAAGSADIGSHSMAIDVDGALYGWGVPYATGHGQMQPALSPLMVKFPENQPNEKVAKIIDVSCGGGFTVAVLSTGEVASWGMWAHGRLGLGSPPESQLNRGAGARKGKLGREKRKVVRYQLKPKIIPQLKNAIKVSCGEAHTLCLTRTGTVYSWGQNSCGQLGIGPTPSGLLRDMMTPTPIHFLDSLEERIELRRYQANSSNRAKIRVRDICCGTFHSLVVDTNNNVWSWGGRGDICLGHNDSQLHGIWLERGKTVFPTLTNSTKLMVPYELLDWCKQWALPRIIKSLHFPNEISQQRDFVVQIAAGDMHSSILYGSGRMYFCGNGPVVSPMQMRTEIDNDEDDNESEVPINAVIDEIEKQLINVTTPRCPSARWFEKLSTRKIKFVCSAGTYSVIVQDEDMVVSSLTDSLLHQTTNNTKLFLTTDTPSTADNGSISTGTTSKQTLPLLGRGKADCLLIAAGKILASHRGILANRCAFLREKLIEEAPIDDGLPGSVFTPTQVLLPDLMQETATSFHFYLYTDCLPPKCVKNLSSLQSLQRIAKRMRIPRLIAACDSFISIHREISKSLYEEENDDILDYNENEKFPKMTERLTNNSLHSVFSNLMIDLPPSTLARDLGSLVGDAQYADIRFIAEGRTISAHRFILEARCEYFRIMFSSGMIESIEDTSPAVVDIVVPDSFVGLLRFLIYLYTDILPDGSDGALLEDLMSADRYQVPDLKRLCESMLVPTQTNWLDLLRAAHLFHCPQLEVSVLGFLRDHINEIVKINDSESLAEEFPTLLSDVLELRRIAYPLPPDQSLIDHTAFVKQKAEEKRTKIHLPWWSIVMAIALSFAYREVVSIVSLGPLIPLINVLGLCGLVYYFYQTVLRE